MKKMFSGMVMIEAASGEQAGASSNFYGLPNLGRKSSSKEPFVEAKSVQKEGKKASPDTKDDELYRKSKAADQAGEETKARIYQSMRSLSGTDKEMLEAIIKNEIMVPNSVIAAEAHKMLNELSAGLEFEETEKDEPLRSDGSNPESPRKKYAYKTKESDIENGIKQAIKQGEDIDTSIAKTISLAISKEPDISEQAANSEFEGETEAEDMSDIDIDIDF